MRTTALEEELESKGHKMKGDEEMAWADPSGGQADPHGGEGGAGPRCGAWAQKDARTLELLKQEADKGKGAGN